MSKDTTEDNGRREGLDGGGTSRAMVARRPRNTSGNASALASVVALRAELNLAWEVIQGLAERLGDDPEFLAQVKDIREKLQKQLRMFR